MPDVVVEARVDGVEQVVNDLERITAAIENLSGINAGATSLPGGGFGGSPVYGGGGGYGSPGGGGGGTPYPGTGFYAGAGSGGNTSAAYATLPPMQPVGSDGGFTVPQPQSNGGGVVQPGGNVAVGGAPGGGGGGGATPGGSGGGAGFDAVGAASAAASVFGRYGGGLGAGIATAGSAMSFLPALASAAPFVLGASALVGAVGAVVQYNRTQGYERERLMALPQYEIDSDIMATRMGGNFVDPVSERTRREYARIQGQYAARSVDFEFGGADYLKNVFSFGGTKKQYELEEVPEQKRKLQNLLSEEQYQIQRQQVRALMATPSWDFDFGVSPSAGAEQLKIEAKLREIQRTGIGTNSDPMSYWTPGGVATSDARPSAETARLKKRLAELKAEASEQAMALRRQYLGQLSEDVATTGYFNRGEGAFGTFLTDTYNKGNDDRFHDVSGFRTDVLPGDYGTAQGYFRSAPGMTGAYRNRLENGAIGSSGVEALANNSILGNDIAALASALRIWANENKGVSGTEYKIAKDALFERFFAYRETAMKSDLAVAGRSNFDASMESMRLGGADPLAILGRQRGGMGFYDAQVTRLETDLQLSQNDPVRAQQITAQLQSLRNRRTGEGQGIRRDEFGVGLSRADMSRDEFSTRFQRDSLSGASSETLQGDIAMNVRYYNEQDRLLSGQINSAGELGLNPDEVRRLRNEREGIRTRRDYGLKRDVFDQYSSDYQAASSLRSASYADGESRAKLYGGVDEVTRASSASLETILAEIKLGQSALANKPMSDKERKETEADVKRATTALAEASELLVRQQLSMMTGLAQTQESIGIQGSQRLQRYGVSTGTGLGLLEKDATRAATSYRAANAEAEGLAQSIREQGGDPEKNQEYLAAKSRAGSALDNYIGYGSQMANMPNSVGLRNQQGATQFALSALSIMPGSYGNIRGLLQGKMGEAEDKVGEIDQMRAAVIKQYGFVPPEIELQLNERKRGAAMEQAQAFSQLSYGWQNRMMSMVVNAPGSMSFVAPGLSYRAAVGAGVLSPMMGANGNDMPYFMREAMKIGSMAGAGSAEGFTMGGLTGAGVGRGFAFGSSEMGMGGDMDEEMLSQIYAEASGRRGAPPRNLTEARRIVGQTYGSASLNADRNSPRFIGHGAWDRDVAGLTHGVRSGGGGDHGGGTTQRISLDPLTIYVKHEGTGMTDTHHLNLRQSNGGTYGQIPGNNAMNAALGGYKRGGR